MVTVGGASPSGPAQVAGTRERPVEAPLSPQEGRYSLLLTLLTMQLIGGPFRSVSGSGAGAEGVDRAFNS